MKINTGQGTIPLITLIGIWSVSALTSLPGLAVSPILGELSTIFPHATELDIQMLTSLPSLLIIPLYYWQVNWRRNAILSVCCGWGFGCLQRAVYFICFLPGCGS